MEMMDTISNGQKNKWLRSKQKMKHGITKRNLRQNKMHKGKQSLMRLNMEEATNIN